MTNIFDRKIIIHYTIIVVLMFGIGFLPPIATITPFGMKILGVFAALLYAWTNNIIMWPCFVAIIYLASFQDLTVLAALSAVVGNQTLLQVMAVLAFCYALESCGLMSYLGSWVMSQKIIQKGPYYFLATFWIFAYVASALTFNNAGVMLIVWAVFYQIADEIGIKKHSKYANVMLIGTAVIAYHGSVFFPFALWPNVVFGLYASVAGEPIVIPYAMYMGFNLLTGIIMITLSIVITKFVLRPEVSFDLKTASIGEKELKMTVSQKFAAVSLLVIVAFLLAPSFMPNDSAIKIWMSNMSIAGIFMMIMVLLSFFKKPNGDSVSPLENNIQYGINWQQFFLLGLAFYMASILTTPETGIAPLLSNLMAPILEGKSAIFVICFFIIFGTILTNCINNVVSVSLLLPFVLLFGPQLGLNMMVLIAALTFMLVQGCALPSGSVIGGLLHSNKEWLHAKNVYFYSLFYTSVLAVIVCVCAVIMN